MVNSAIGEFKQDILKRGRKLITANKYADTIALYDEWRVSQPVRDTADSLAEWINYGRSKGLSSAAIRQRLAIARAYCDFLKVDRGPLKDYKCPPMPLPVPHPLPGGMDSVKEMLAYESGDGKFATALCAYAGLRIDEAVTIERQHVQIRSNGASRYTVLVIQGKGDREREVPVSDALADVLTEMPSKGRLVSLTNRGARAAITRIAHRSGVEGPHGSKVSSHDLRATFATAVYNKTHNIILVKNLLGHSSVKTTQLYIGGNVDETRQAVEF